MKSAQILNLVLVSALGIGLGVASVFAFPQAENPLTPGWSYEGSFLWDETIEVAETLTARLNNRDSVSLLAGTKSTSNWQEEQEAVSIDLETGALFFASKAGDFSVSVQTPFARVDSENSNAYVSFNAETNLLEVFALDHPSTVTFLSEGEDLNALLIPTGYKMKIPGSKVTETLARLRLTKLSKEFQIFAFENGELPEDVQILVENSESAYKDSSLAYLNQVQKNSDFGPSLTGVGGIINGGLQFFENILTVLPNADLRLEEDERDSALTYALTNLLYGDSVAGQTWVSVWQSFPQDPEEVKGIYRSLSFVLPGEELYPVKAAAAEVLSPEQAPLTTLRRQFQEIESLLAAGYQVEAQGAYQDYQARFEEALHSGDLDEEAMLDDISREYVLLELLLRSNSVFYSTDAVKLLSDLEEAILSLAGSDQDLDEERQAFVQSKIRFLQNLFAYVMERKISLETATDLANELLSEAESTLASITSKVAVRDYFETKLEEFDLSIAFMNSPEFYSYDSFDIGLADYRSKEANLEDLNEYIQSLRVGEDDETVTISLEDATAEVEETLHDNSIQFATVESLGDSSYRLFEIAGARTGGIAFEANYDRETQILYDVVVGEVRFSTGLSLEMAKQVIEGTVSDAEVVEDEEPATAVEDDETPTESLAISRVEAALEAADLEVSDFAVTLVDLEENLFTLEGSFDKGKLLVSGTYDLDTGLVSEIVLESEGQSYTAEDTSLVDLETVSLKL